MASPEQRRMRGPASICRLILNADDFGASARVNEAVAKAHGAGLLTSASLMVNEAAAGDAVTVARQHPGLAVGLHLVLSCGKPALAAGSIPHLVQPNGSFPASPAGAGLRVFFHKAAREEAAREIAAQFERFADTGLAFDHVNGHQHLHVHPVIWRSMVEQCLRFGVRAVRVPLEELRFFTRGQEVRRGLEWAAFRALGAWCLRSARRHGLVTADRVYGHLETGRVTEKYLLFVVNRLQPGVSEVYLHPGSAGEEDYELQALLSPAVRSAVEERRVELYTYGRLAAHTANADASDADGPYL